MLTVSCTKVLTLRDTSPERLAERLWRKVRCHRCECKEAKGAGRAPAYYGPQDGSVSFKPGPVLQAQLNRVKFVVDNDYTEPTDAALLDEALYNYFAIEKKEGINMKRFASLSGYGITRARKLMKEYVAQGVMEHVPLSRGYYRPTKGNFGR